MNSQNIGVFIGFAMMIFAIFGANWLTKSDLNKRIDDLRSHLDAKLEAEFKAVRAEIETVRSEVANLSARVDRLERQFDALYKPVR